MHLPQRAKGGVAAAVLDGVRGTTAGRLLLMVPVVEGGTGELDPKRRIDVAAGAELRRVHEGGERAPSPPSWCSNGDAMTTKLPPAQGRPILVVPWRVAGGVDAPAPPVRAREAAQLNYRGGTLLTAVEVVTAFWGVAWNEATAQATVQALNSFFQFVVASPYLDQLAEYGTPQLKIGRGHYAGTVRVTDTAPSASATDSAIQQMLEAAVARKSLPAPTANTVYFAFLPPGVTVVAGSERSCQAFCGYHDRSAGGLYYAVVPYPNCSGCLGNLAPLDALTSVCSHELAEAITDPVPGQGWYNDTNGEIGDICAWQNQKLRTYEVQLLWSNAAQAAAVAISSTVARDRSLMSNTSPPSPLSPARR